MKTVCVRIALAGLSVVLLKRAVFAIGVMLSAGAAQAGVLTTINFGSDGLDILTARLPNSGDYCTPNGTFPPRPCFSDKTETLADSGKIEHVTLTATLQNSFSLDELSLSLSHAGVTVVLFEGSSPHGFVNRVTITFDDLAPQPLPIVPVSGTFRPEGGPLSAFNGLDAAGDWTLTVGDWDIDDRSSYSNAVLSITVPEPGTFALLGLALAGLGLSRRRKLH